MGKLYDENIFNRPGATPKQETGGGNRLFLTLVVIAGLAVAGMGGWRWWNQSQRVFNVNTASVEELQYVPSVGPVIAREIVAGRPYAKLEDLKRVKGIGDKTFEKMKPRVKVE